MISKNINYDNKYFDIQIKKDELIDLKDLTGNINLSIDTITIVSNYFFILTDKEYLVFNWNSNMDKYRTIILKFNSTYNKVVILNNYLYLINEQFIIKYNWDNLNELEEFKWKNEITIKKIRQYKNYLIIGSNEWIIIFDLWNFAELLNLKVEYEEDDLFSCNSIKSIFNIIIFKNYLVYNELNIIKILNWEKKFIKEKEFFLYDMFKNKIVNTYLKKNYLINFDVDKKIINIIDFENNYKNIIINNFKGGSSYLEFKINKILLLILRIDEIIIYDVDKIEFITNIKIKANIINKIIFLRNLLISYNHEIKNYTVIDYKDKIFNLNIVENKECYKYKSYNYKLICIENKKLIINEFKTDLKIISKIKNYKFKFKNFGIKANNNIKIYDTNKNHKLIYEKKIENTYFKTLLYDNYLVLYFLKELMVLNLENFEDFRKIEYEFNIDNINIYKDTLFILFKFKYIEVLNIINFNNKKILESNASWILIKIYIDYLFILKEKSIEAYDLNNNIKLLKKIDLLIEEMPLFEIKHNYINIYNRTKYLYLINIKNNFELINIKENLEKRFHIFNDLLIFYDQISVIIYDKCEKIKIKLANITFISSLNQYLFIRQNEENYKIVTFENNKFNVLKKINMNINFKYILEDLWFLIKYNILNIYNIKNNFEEIKRIKFEEDIYNFKIENNYIIFDDGIHLNKILLNFDNNNKFTWDKISYNYYLKFENLNINLNINLKVLYDFYKERDMLNNIILFNYIFKINYNIIKYTENPNFLSESLELFGYDKLYIKLKNDFNCINQIIFSNKVNIFLEPILNYFINNNHFYEINYSQFLWILEKIKNMHLFKIFIKYIFQKTEIAIEYREIKYININDYKILKSTKLYFDNDRIFNNKSYKEKKKFEIYNIPFMISDKVSDNYKLFETLVKSPDFIKESNLKYLIYYFFDKTVYFKYFNIFMYLLIIISMTINLINRNFVLLLWYILSWIYFIFYEIMQFYYDYKTYFKQLINLFDILLIIYNIIIFIYIYLGLFKSINLLIMTLYYLNGYKLINFLKSIDLIRKEIRLFINVIKNTYSFIFFIFIILIYFTNLNFLFNFNNFNKFNLSFFNVYGQMLGNFDDNFNEYRFYDFLEILINTYSFNIILLNLFISVISKIFDNYNENLELYDIQEKINLLQEFSSVYFIIDYINKFIFKTNNDGKYFFFIFEKKQQEINLIEIKKELIDLKSNIKLEAIENKKEIRKITNKVVEEVKSEVKDIKTSLNNMEFNIKNILENLKNNN